MKRVSNTITAVLFCVASALYVVAIDYVTTKVDDARKLEQCLEEYGEGDLGMCMCHQLNNNQ